MPAFAIDRTAVLLHELTDLAHHHLIPRLPVYVNSPMALAALNVYRAAVAGKSPELRAGWSGLVAAHAAGVPVGFGGRRGQAHPDVDREGTGRAGDQRVDVELGQLGDLLARARRCGG